MFSKSYWNFFSFAHLFIMQIKVFIMIHLVKKEQHDRTCFIFNCECCINGYKYSIQQSCIWLNLLFFPWEFLITVRWLSYDVSQWSNIPTQAIIQHVVYTWNLVNKIAFIEVPEGTGKTGSDKWLSGISLWFLDIISSGFAWAPLMDLGDVTCYTKW